MQIQICNCAGSRGLQAFGLCENVLRQWLGFIQHLNANCDSISLFIVSILLGNPEWKCLKCASNDQSQIKH